MDGKGKPSTILSMAGEEDMVEEVVTTDNTGCIGSSSD